MRILLVDDQRGAAEYVRRELDGTMPFTYGWQVTHALRHQNIVTPILESIATNLDVLMNFLRLKVDAPGLPKLIYTERGIRDSSRKDTA
jgi:hypothetical protein